MKIARILYPVHTLGPGERVAIWTYGCEHGCKNCANPELWKWEGKPKTRPESLKALLEQIKQRGAIDGITITGGDPFLDADSLEKILKTVNEYTQDILVYTGYSKEKITVDKKKNRLLDRIAVLIDGPYREEENNGHVLKGSANQKIYYLKEQYKKSYEKYIRENNGKYLVENFTVRDGIISVGIHKPDFREKLENYRMGEK